ncbi:MAG: phage tail protein [Winogradskyella sp.]|nr:MAG: phage tail protein [Winogradskyella sp.]
MANQAAKYPVGFYFTLSFKGEDAAFKEVSGISKEMTVEEVSGGGENRFKYRLPSVSNGQNLVLKRALMPVGSKLMNWCSSTIDQGLSKPIQTHAVSVSLLNEKGKVCKKWTFNNAYPIKYSISDLKSDSNDLVLETIELAYSFFEITTKKSIKGLFLN